MNRTLYSGIIMGMPFVRDSSYCQSNLKLQGRDTYMGNLRKTHYKETTPDKTVRFLRAVLEELNVQVEECWQRKSTIGTFSLRLNFKGTEIGANGKGVSKAYALASAYAELFERYQNDIIGPIVSFGKKYPFYSAPDEQIYDSMQIAQSKNAFIDMYFRERGLSDSTDKEKAEAFYASQKIDRNVHGMDDRYIMLPFYSIKNKTVVYLPKSTYGAYYGSNGMCAGNTTEEALVQGIAEIIERSVQKKIFLEQPALPDVPAEYIKRFPYIYNIFNSIKDGNKYDCRIKDASLGGRYPVAALIVYEKNTGKYGFRLGCHPDFAIAIERTLTEATQGQDVTDYAQRSILDFNDESVKCGDSIYNSYKFALGQYPYQLFDNRQSYDFIMPQDVSHMDNSQMLKGLINDIVSEGYDILVRDVSYLGFPSYHVIIPGLSELQHPDDKKFRAINTRYYISEMLREAPEKIDESNCKLFIATMEYFIGNVYENTMKSYYGIVDEKDIPCENINCGCAYMIAMCSIIIGDYENAGRKMKHIVNTAQNYYDKHRITKDELSFYKALEFYIKAFSRFNNHDEALEYLSVFFDSKYCEQIDEIFSDRSKVIIKQYPCVYKNGISNRDMCKAQYNTVTYYCECLRRKQESTAIEQEKLAKVLTPEVMMFS